MKQAEHDESQRSFTLFYANRFIKDVAFHQELQNIVLTNFRYVTVLSKSEDPCAPMNDERGYICAPILSKYVDDIQKNLYYIVGAPQFIEAMEKMLSDLGVPKEQCKKDPFTGLRASEKK